MYALNLGPALGMIVNYVWVDDGEVTVGATTPTRWRWELEDGRETGADAKTLVFATYTNPRPGVAPQETVGFHVDPADPERGPALAAVGTLLEAAREIHGSRPRTDDAVGRWFGRRIS